MRELIFGTMHWGGVRRGIAAEIFLACRKAGKSWFDTAHLYSGDSSEEILGRIAAYCFSLTR